MHCTTKDGLFWQIPMPQCLDWCRGIPPASSRRRRLAAYSSTRRRRHRRAANQWEWHSCPAIRWPLPPGRHTGWLGSRAAPSMVCCGMYSVHTNIFSFCEATSNLGMVRGRRLRHSLPAYCRPRRQIGATRPPEAALTASPYIQSLRHATTSLYRSLCKGK